MGERCQQHRFETVLTLDQSNYTIRPFRLGEMSSVLLMTGMENIDTVLWFHSRRHALHHSKKSPHSQNASLDSC